MPDYQNGKIYEIINDQTDERYIGSTTVFLSKRMVQHRSKYNKYLKNGIKQYTSCNILKYDSAKIVLIENFPCNSSFELHARERHWINISKCVNKNLPCRTNKEYYEDNKQKIKQYYEDNKQKIKEYKKKYYEDNKEKIKEEKREKITCECGSEITRRCLARHKKSQKHINLMKIKNQ